MDALFNVYKPKGPTSHDVVARLRRASGVKRIGHAGTLDPLAEGVLIVAAGQATRVVEYLAGLDKAYLAQVTLGVETDTYDAEGRVVAERPVGDIGRTEIEAALGRFRGEIEQRPPAFSAVSVGGQRLYDLARRGRAAQAPARRVQITRVDLIDWAPPVATLHVECSKGTYVRSLAHDLGQALGCGAHLSGLVRLRVGSFVAHNATPLGELEARLRDGRWQAVAMAPSVALAHLPAVRFGADDARRLANGRAVSGGDANGEPIPSGALARALAPDATFIAVVRLDQSDSDDRGDRGGRAVWRPEKVFGKAE